MVGIDRNRKESGLCEIQTTWRRGNVMLRVMEQEERTPAGIVLPGNAKEKSVLAAGPGETRDSKED